MSTSSRRRPRPGLTVEQHQALGRELRGIAQRLGGVLRQLEAAGYPLRVAAPLWRIVRTGGLLDRLALNLENAAVREHPDAPEMGRAYAAAETGAICDSQPCSGTPSNGNGQP